MGLWEIGVVPWWSVVLVVSYAEAVTVAEIVFRFPRIRI